LPNRFLSVADYSCKLKSHYFFFEFFTLTIYLLKQTNEMKKNYLVKMRGLMLSAVVWLCATAAFAQKTVSGKISDGANGIPGASISIKGTTIGKITDANGNFSIDTRSKNDVLVISSIGYKTTEVAVGNQTAINVSLSEDASSLDEVVVTGYAAQEKKNITGSVAIIDTKDMLKVASSNFADQLQGKVAGVQMSTSGDPGASAFVRIRGIGTINNNEPLYVIDGVPVQNESNLNFLNPSDIESMQVLKDAASASIYGSRAANGVVVITTKKGKGGVSKLNFDVYHTFASPGKIPETLNPAEFLKVQQQLAAGQGIPFASNIYIKNGSNWDFPDYAVRGLGGFKAGDPAVDPSKYYLNTDPTSGGAGDYLILKTNPAGTNWFKEVFRPVQSNNYQISGSSGTEKGNFYFSANYYDQNGIMLANNYKRYQVRANGAYNVRKNIRVGENLNIAYQTTRGGQGNPNEGSALIGTYGLPQLVPVYDIMGNFASPANFNANVANPVAQQIRSLDNNGHSMRITGNIYGEVDVLPYLTFKTSFGSDYGSGPGQNYGTRRYENTEGNTNPNTLQNTYYLNNNWVAFNTLSFNKTFGDHAVTALTGIESKKNYYEGFNAGGSKLDFDVENYRILNNVNSKTYYMSSYRGENRVYSQFVQASYAYKGKYLVSGTVRRDGSSRFLNNRYGIFPAGSIGWRLSNEDFMKDLSFVTSLKLRASYGVLGNNEVGGDYPGFSNYSTSPGTSSYDITGTGNSNRAGFDQTSTGSPNLKWESTAVTNIGFDATLFKNLDFTLEWYTRKTTDMLYNVELPLESGAIGRQAQNIGRMDNTGIDAQLNYRGAISNNLKYTVGITGSTYTNKVVNLEANSATFIRSAGSRIGDLTKTAGGLPISQFYGYVADGIWQSQGDLDKTLFLDKGDAKVGRMKFKDLNGDGKISDADETNIGSPIPKFLLGLNLGASYKGFDFTAFINGVYGNKILNFVKYFTEFNAFQRNRSKNFLYEAGKTQPVIDGSDNYSSQRSSFYVENGSYTRLKNLQLGYTLPNNIASKIGMGKVRVYVQGMNLVTLTKYSGLDPDVTISNITEGYNSQRDLSLGVDFGRIPLTKSIVIGTNIEF
jgi:TonB-dependent starch-binding outer membrane protein SusC